MAVPGPPNHHGKTQYGEYLEVVEKLRDLWCPQGPVDVVEYQLFIAGGRKNLWWGSFLRRSVAVGQLGWCSVLALPAHSGLIGELDVGTYLGGSFGNINDAGVLSGTDDLGELVGLVSWRIQGVTTLVDREDIELRMTNGAVRDYHAPEMYALV